MDFGLFPVWTITNKFSINMLQIFVWTYAFISLAEILRGRMARSYGRCMLSHSSLMVCLFLYVLFFFPVCVLLDTFYCYVFKLTNLFLCNV